MNNLSKIQKYIIIVAIIIATGIVGYYVYGREQESNIIIEEDEIDKTDKKLKEEQAEIVIHITGAVNKEGIVVLKENSRVADAIEAAGGLKDDADMNKINLAYILEDGMKIKIPSVNDISQQEKNEDSTENVEVVENIPESNKKSETNIVNINKASQTELETLPGIGPSIALKIINYREENGKFSSIEDLKKVSGIGDNKYEIIKGLISVK